MDTIFGAGTRRSRTRGAGRGLLGKPLALVPPPGLALPLRPPA